MIISSAAFATRYNAGNRPAEKECGRTAHPIAGIGAAGAEKSIVGTWISLWADLYDAGEKLLLAGLRLKIGPDGDIKRAYQDWLKAYYDDHDQVLFRLAEGLNRSKEIHAG